MLHHLLTYTVFWVIPSHPIIAILTYYVLCRITYYLPLPRSLSWGGKTLPYHKSSLWVMQPITIHSTSSYLITTIIRDRNITYRNHIYYLYIYVLLMYLLFRVLQMPILHTIWSVGANNPNFDHYYYYYYSSSKQWTMAGCSFIYLW